MLLRKIGGPAIDISVLPDGRFRAAILRTEGERPLPDPSLFDAETAAQALAQARAALADAEAAPARVVRTAAELTADLAKPKPGVYWLDFLLSAAIGYGALAGAIVISLWWLEATLGLIASVALYRALSFIHELTHLKPQSLPGFRLAWNLLLGIPLLLPSFLYEGVHNLHHARSRYGTREDPEYLPLHRMGRGALLLFWLASLLMPLALLLRFAVLAPLSLLSPALRRLVVRRFSALSIAPGFIRALPAGRLRRDWIRLEVATSLWSWGFILLCASNSLPLAAASTAVLVVGGSALLNQTRTLVAHRWDSDGAPGTLPDQYRDSVNLIGPRPLVALLAPVGLRYHALHHLLPGLPYHALGEAHRRLSREAPAALAIAEADEPHLGRAFARLWSRPQGRLAS